MFFRLRYFWSPQTLIPLGYFENWKVFDPRKPSPVSIDAWRAEIAVITLMIEKMPMVMPDVVSAERSLLAPNAFQAILTSSQFFIITRTGAPPPDSGRM